MALLDDRRQEGSVLELGSGDGRDTLAMLRRGYSVTAIDLSETATRKLIARVQSKREWSERLSVLCCDVRTWQYPTEEFDVVAAITVLDHVDVGDGRAVAKSMTRALKPGGLLFAQVLTRDDPAITHHGPVSEFSSEIKHYFEHNELLQWFCNSLQIVYYEDRMEWDNDHGEAHVHGMALIAGIKNPLW